MVAEKYDILTKVTELGIGPDKMLNDLRKDQDLVDAYVEFSLSNHKLSWRATWVIAHFSKEHPEQVQKHLNSFIQNLYKIKKDGHLRETLKIITNLKLTEDQTSEVFDICYDLLQNNKLQSSVRYASFYFILKVAEDYPELKEEIKIIFENIKDYLSNGIKHSMEKRLKN